MAPMLTAGASVGPPSAVAAGAGGGARKPPTMLGVLSGMLECTVCFERPPANIYQCTEGHLLCQDCWSRLQGPDAGCPTCSSVLGQIRCRFAEEARDRLLPVKGGAPSVALSPARAKLPAMSRQSNIKKAADKIGVSLGDLRGTMAREGVGLIEAVILSARSKVREGIEDAGGVDRYETVRRKPNPPTPNSVKSPKRAGTHGPAARAEEAGPAARGGAATAPVAGTAAAARPDGSGVGPSPRAKEAAKFVKPQRPPPRTGGGAVREVSE
ncbi:hypothetical protein T484DRAFT_1899239, partial [Baffinella frigidus]